MARTSVASVTRKARKRKPRKNPIEAAAEQAYDSIATDVTSFVVPGFAGYAGARIAGRIGYKLGKKKSESVARIAGGASPLVVAVALYLWARHREHDPDQQQMYDSAMVGASVAALQSLIQAIAPQYGWPINDYHFDDRVMLPGYTAVPANGKALSEPSATSPEPEEDDFSDVFGDDDVLGNFGTGIF